MPASAEQVRIPQQVRERAQLEGRARVIVELVLPTGAHVPEGHLKSPAAVSRQRQGIATAQAAVLTRLRGTPHRLVRQYQTVPFLALEVGPAADRKSVV